MTKNSNYLFPEEALFTFENNPVNIQLDVKNEFVGCPPKYILKIAELEQEKKIFAYEYGNGLNLINTSTSEKFKKNVLGHFVSLDGRNKEQLCLFFNKYGYLFRVSKNKYHDVDVEIINKIHKRITALLDLINFLNEDVDVVNYRRIFELSLYLLFEDRWSLSINLDDNTTIEYCSCNYHDILDSLNSAYDLSTKKRDSELLNKKTITISDLMYDNTVEFNGEIYRNIINGYTTEPGFDDEIFRELMMIYANDKSTNIELRKILHTMFNFYYKIGIPKNIYHDKVEYFKPFQTKNFDEFNFSDGIIDFGNYIVKKEIDHHIKDIRACYDIYNYRPQWHLNCLLDALYFSIFYLDSKREMYKQCPYCKNYFIVRRSNVTKKYCSKSCSNKAAQAAHRARIKSIKKIGTNN